MKLILLGAPGAGKGTQAENISKKYNIPAISTGDMIRAAIKSGSDLGKEVQSYIEKGHLVPDETVIAIVKERIAQPDCANGFILDGFPRTIPQAEALDSLSVNVDFALSIEVEDERIVQRMSGRRACPSCGMTYHLEYKPSKDNKTCDGCGTELVIRKDDKPETVLERLKIYHDQTEPLKAYYKAQGKLLIVEGQEELSETTALTFKAIEGFMK
ncbi:MAG: adenylate kinase [Clostridia bacterium]|nr:adenylate kinase [Clostridia bacterium]